MKRASNPTVAAAYIIGVFFLVIIIFLLNMAFSAAQHPVLSAAAILAFLGLMACLVHYSLKPPTKPY